jgi:hypothetical protein
MGDMTKQKELTMKDTYNKVRLRKKQEETRANHLRTPLPQRCGRIHINDAPKSKQEMDGMQEIPLSDLV